MINELYIQDIQDWGPVEIRILDNVFGVFVPDVGLFDSTLIYSPIAWEFRLGARNSIEEETLQIFRRDIIPQLIQYILSTPDFVSRLETWHKEKLEELGARIPTIEQELVANRDLLIALQRRPSPIEPGVGALGQIHDYLVAAGFDAEIVGCRKGFILGILEGNPLKKEGLK